MFGSTASPFTNNQNTGFGQQQQQSAFGSTSTNTTTPFGGTGANTGFGFGSTGANTTSAFGSSTPSNAFGGTPGFGGGSAFGSNTTGFGSTAAAPSGGIFGSAAPAPSGGLFGSSSTTAGGGLFGSSNTGTSAFGSAPAPSGGLFGSAAPAPFGASSSTFGASNTSGGIFGTQNTSTTPFGQQQPQQQQQQQRPGTMTQQYQATSRPDGSNNNIVLHAITAMSAYENKSFEELRLEDYMAGNKGQSQQQNTSTGFGFGSAPAPASTFGSTSLFGSAPAAPAPAFGAPAPSTGVFGNTSTAFGSTNTAFGAAPAPGNFAFGQPAAAPANNAFGFGAAPKPATTSLFGQPAAAPAPSTGLFGQPAANPTPAPLFGSAPAAPAPAFGFGSPNAPAPSTGLFGSSTAPTSPFGAPATTAPSTGLFGSTTAPAPSLFGSAPATAPSTGLFGQSAAPQTSLFGQSTTAPSTGLFGAPATGSVFGAPAPTTTGLFGQPAAAPSTGLFGQPTAAPTSLFGASSTPSLFGNTAAQAPPAAIAAAAPNAQAILAQKLAVIEAQKKELALSDNWRSTTPSSITVTPISMPNPSSGSSPLKQSSRNMNTFHPYQYRPSPSLINIRPRGLTKHSTTNTAIDKQKTQQKYPIFSPNTFFASTCKKLTVDPDALLAKPTLLLTDKDHSKTPEIEKNTPLPSPLVIQNGSCSTTPRSARSYRDDPASSKKNLMKDYYSTVTNDKSDDFVPILTNPDFLTTPSIEVLSKMPKDDLTSVANFSIERTNYGKIHWIDPVDITCTNLDSVISIKDREAMVYHTEQANGTKPPQGTKLNNPAIISLYNIFPKSGSKATDKEKRKFTKKVEAHTNAMADTTLISYNVDLGVWKFRVDHFSRYALFDESDDSDDEESVPSSFPLEKQFIKPTQSTPSSIQSTLFQAPRDDDDDSISDKLPYFPTTLHSDKIKAAESAYSALMLRLKEEGEKKIEDNIDLFTGGYYTVRL